MTLSGIRVADDMGSLYFDAPWTMVRRGTTDTELYEMRGNPLGTSTVIACWPLPETGRKPVIWAYNTEEEACRDWAAIPGLQEQVPATVGPSI